MDHCKTAKIMITVLGLVLLVYFYSLSHVVELPLENKFAGTFLSGEGLYQTSFWVDQENKKFQYENQYNRLTIAGTFEENNDGTFFIKCNILTEQAIIPNQTIEYNDFIFDTHINGEIVSFKKFSNIPIRIGSLEK